MKKIPTIYERNPDDLSTVTDTPNPAAQWVFDGEGRATRKFDGTAVRVCNGIMWKRFDCKSGRVPPIDFEPCQPESDPLSGHWPGWVLVLASGKADRPYHEAFNHWVEVLGVSPSDGTYELCGPKVNGNPEKFDRHTLIPHGFENISDAQPGTAWLVDYFNKNDVEGIVWHHKSGDGRMAKIKARDFGIKRGRRLVDGY